jgi:hypothetical protein
VEAAGERIARRLGRRAPARCLDPATALVTHPRTVPLSVDDGEVVAHFPEARDGATSPIEAKLYPSRRRAWIFADPRAEPDRLMPICLRHSEAEAPRS